MIFPKFDTLCHCQSSIFKKVRVRLRANPNPKLMQFENKIFNLFKNRWFGFRENICSTICISCFRFRFRKI